MPHFVIQFVKHFYRANRLDSNNIYCTYPNHIPNKITKHCIMQSMQHKQDLPELRSFSVVQVLQESCEFEDMMVHNVNYVLYVSATRAHRSIHIKYCRLFFYSGAWQHIRTYSMKGKQIEHNELLVSCVSNFSASVQEPS